MKTDSVVDATRMVNNVSLRLSFMLADLSFQQLGEMNNLVHVGDYAFVSHISSSATP